MPVGVIPGAHRGVCYGSLLLPAMSTASTTALMTWGSDGSVRCWDVGLCCSGLSGLLAHHHIGKESDRFPIYSCAVASTDLHPTNSSLSSVTVSCGVGPSGGASSHGDNKFGSFLGVPIHLLNISV
jgi:hypothetical protein